MAETAAEISADLVALRSARTKLAIGQRVEEVWRSGRRLTYGKITLESLNTLITARENDLACATATEAGSKRRRAISLGWPN